MEPKECGIMPDVGIAPASTDLQNAISRLDDAVNRIQCMTDYSKEKNDALYGAVPENAKTKENAIPEGVGAISRLNDITNAIHEACTNLNEQLGRQEDLV